MLSSKTPGAHRFALALVALSVGCQHLSASTTDAATSPDDASSIGDASDIGDASGIGDASVAGGKGTGGSTATCSPSPCTPGAAVSRTILADDGSGYMVNFTYAVTRPVGLTNSSTNKAPLMIDIFADSTPAFAAANKYVYVFIPQPPQCPATVPNCGYATRAINPNAANIALANTCGPPTSGGAYGTGTGPCDMKYELKAILDAVIASENIDPDKVFVGGASKGGYATLDAVCDPLTSGYFRGGVVISANISGSKVSPPATANVTNSKMLCPALTSPPVNQDLSLLFIHGTSDSAVVDQGKVVSWPDGTSSWYYDQHQDLVAGVNPPLGCAGPPITTHFGTGSANVRDSWACSAPHRMTQLDTITSGGHTCSALDSVNGYDCRTAYWSFLTSH